MLEYVRHSSNDILTATLSSAQEQSGFPLSNLKDQSTSVDCRLSKASPTTIQIARASGSDFDTFALIGHNFTSSAVIQVYGGASPNPGTLLWTLDWSRFDILKYLDTPLSHQYLKITVDDSTNPSRAFQLGNVVVGTREVTLIKLQTDFEVSKSYVENSYIEQSGYANSKYLTTKRSYAFRTEPLLLSEAVVLRTLSHSLKGTELALWMFEKANFFGYGLLSSSLEREFNLGPRNEIAISVSCSPRAILIYPPIQIRSERDRLSVSVYKSGVNGSREITSPSLGAIQILGYQSSVNPESAISSSLGTMSLVTYSSTVSQTVTVDSSLGTLTINGYSSSVRSASTVESSLGTITVSGYNSQIQVVISVSSPLVTLAISDYSSEVAGSKFISSSLGQLSIAGYASQVRHGSDIVNSTLGTLETRGYASSITRVLHVSSTLGSVSISGFASLVNASGSIVSGLSELGITTYASQIRIVISIDSSLGTISISGLASEAIADKNIVSANFGTVSIAGYSSQVGTYGELRLSESSYIAAGGENTTAQLSPPSGKTTGDFLAGRMQDDENPADAIDLGEDQYTELEWSFEAAPWAEKTTYEFRIVTSSDASLDTYDVTPQVSLKEAAVDSSLGEASVSGYPSTVGTV